MAVYALIFVLSAIVIVLFVLTGMYVASRRALLPHDPIAAARREDHAGTRMWSTHVGSLDDPPGMDEPVSIPVWKQHLDAARASEVGTYKSRRASPLKGEHWDPFAESQSRANRAKAARRKPRPHRAAHSAESFILDGEAGDAYRLLGLSRVASEEEIERAYRRRVSAIHPDKFHGDPVGQQDAVEKLKQLNLAMKVLRESLARSRHGSDELPT